MTFCYCPVLQVAICSAPDWLAVPGAVVRLALIPRAETIRRKIAGQGAALRFSPALAVVALPRVAALQLLV
jgi:hypothetical protein